MIGYENAPRYADMIRRLVGDDEISPPGLVVEMDRDCWSFLKGERLWILAATLGASVGNFSTFALGTGAATGDVLQEVLGFQATNACQLAIGVIAGAAGSNRAIPTDGRVPGVQARLFTRQGAQVIVGVGWNYPTTNFVASTRNGTLPPFILNTQTLIIETVANNTALGVYLWGRERPCTAEEKA